MVTLTFDPDLTISSVNETTARREAKQWCGELGRLYRRPLAWLYVTERQNSGWCQWHVHALVTMVTVAEVERAAETWRIRNGRVDVRPVHDPVGALRYLMKNASGDAGGAVEWSDTLAHLYKDRLRSDPEPSAVAVPASAVSEAPTTPAMDGPQKSSDAPPEFDTSEQRQSAGHRAARPLAAAALRLRRAPGRPRKTQAQSAEAHQGRAPSSKPDGSHAYKTGVPGVCPIEPRLLDLETTAGYLSGSAWTVRDLQAGGTLPRVRVPLPQGGELRKLLFDRRDLDRLITAWKDETPSGALAKSVPHG